MGQPLSDFPSHSPVCLSESLKNFFLAAPLNLSADIVIGNLALKTCQSGGYGKDWLRKEPDTRQSIHLTESTSMRTWLSISSAVFLQSLKDIFKPWMYLTEFNMAMLRMQESFKIQLLAFLGIWEFRKLIPMIFFLRMIFFCFSNMKKSCGDMDAWLLTLSSEPGNIYLTCPRQVYLQQMKDWVPKKIKL